MAIDAQLLAQVLHTPEASNVARSPLVRAAILQDATNAADLVPALERDDTLEAFNARRILALFGSVAVPALLSALRNVDATGRREGLEALWSMLVGEASWAVREALGAGKADLDVLLQDRQSIPDAMPEYVERDFTGRICDLAYIVVKCAIDPRFDQSQFRAYDPRQRDEAIARLRGSGFGLHVV